MSSGRQSSARAGGCVVLQLLGDDHSGAAVHVDEARGNERDVVEVGIFDGDGDLIARAVADEVAAVDLARALCIEGGDLEVRAVDAGEDLIPEVGGESDAGGDASADGAGVTAGLGSAVAAVNDGVAGRVAGVLVDDFVGVVGDGDSDAAEEKYGEDDAGDGEFNRGAAALRGRGQRADHCTTPTVAWPWTL